MVINNRLFRRKSYGYALLDTALAYKTVFVFVTIVMSVLMAWLELEEGISLPAIIQHAINSIFSIWTIIYFVQWGIIMLLTLFFLQVKRDIVFSGDVLNTTSRIQEQCNHYQVKCLISKQTLDLIKDQNTFEPIHLGNIKLRGKQEIIELNTIKVTD